jgi:hypothetical protein
MPPPDMQREAHTLDAPIAFSIERINISEPLLDAIYKIANTIL